MASRTPRAAAAAKQADPGAAPAADVVAAAGVEVDFTPPGSPNTYRIAAPTFGQAGRLVGELADRHRPGAAVMNEAIRDALRELAPPDRADALCGLVDAYEAADDELQSVYAAFGRDDQYAVKEATLGLLRAERGLRRAEALAWDHPGVSALRRRRAEADHAEARLLAGETLRGWAGPELPAFAADGAGRVPDGLLDRLPAHEVAAVAVRVGQLTRPAAAAEKN